jgi:hypothetical protein
MLYGSPEPIPTIAGVHCACMGAAMLQRGGKGHSVGF